MIKNTIREERKKIKITQSELADKINVSRQTIHAIETGRFNCSMVIAQKMARFFGVKTDDLFNLEDNEI